MAAVDAGVGIVGGGLAGALLALALRERGVPVLLLEAADGACATALSYGVIPGIPLDVSPLARRAAGAARVWQALQRRHGDLGWRPRRSLPLPLSQVDTKRLQERLGPVLAAAGVEQRRARVLMLEREPSCWQLALQGGERIAPARLVLAAGAGCLALAAATADPPAPGAELPAALGMSWAGVLALPPAAAGMPYPLKLPTRFERLALEGRSGTLPQPAWVVDAGLVPWGAGGLLGQLSWLAPAGAASPGPPAPQAEGWLRHALAAAPAPLAALAAAGDYRQAPVAFSRNGLPLVGRLSGGVWLFSGFRGAFAQVPVLAPLLAAALAAPAAEAAAAERELRHLGVWPAAMAQG
ncbi:MAG: FAD-dependent oxidoreductase [Synechococcaceae cyanobacterium]|nr:FAD-dependent oxidoreductase [Synechococcaceae cyanobacterium]